MTGIPLMLHRAGAWLFDHSGHAAPTLAALGEQISRLAYPGRLLTDRDRPFLVDGFRIYHDGRPSFHAQMLAVGMHDRDVGAALASIAGPGMSVVDVGAHLGYFTLQSARRVGSSGHVFAFEPSPDLLPLLRRTVAENGMSDAVEVVPSALANDVGTAMLYAGDADSMLSSLYSAAAASGDAVPGGLVVACTTLDAWAAARGWPPIDIVKIDVEGGEVAVLKGMTRLTARSPALAVIVEYNERTLRVAGESPATFATALTACGLDDVFLAGARPRRVNLADDARSLAEVARRRGNGVVNLVAMRSC